MNSHEKKTRTLRYLTLETFKSTNIEDEQPCLIVFDSRKFGTVIPLSTHKVIIGRHDEDVITLGGGEDGISHRHAEFVCEDDSVLVRDLDSNNGIFVNGVKVTQAYLKSGDEILLGRIKLGFQFLSPSEIDSYQSIWVDPLTGTLNRQCFNNYAREIFDDYKKIEKDVTMMLFDIDSYKLVNDNYGHPAGDDILTKLGSKVLSMLQEHMLFFRYGGDEFVILFLGYDHEESYKYILRIQKMIEDAEYIHANDHIQITVSVGTAFMNEIQGEKSLESLLAIADSRLLITKKAKHNS